MRPCRTIQRSAPQARKRLWSRPYSQSSSRFLRNRLGLGFFVRGLFAAGLSELVDVAHAAIQDRRDSRIGLRALLGLVGQHRFLNEPPNQTLQRIVGTFEFGRMMDRSGRTRLTAQPAIHALGDVNIELRNYHRARLRVLLARDDDAVDRAGTFARQASGTDFERS